MAESKETIFSLFIYGHLTSLLSSLKCNPLADQSSSRAPCYFRDATGSGIRFSSITGIVIN